MIKVARLRSRRSQLVIQGTLLYFGPFLLLLPEGKPLESAPKYPRLVMRRESTPHGAGTKLILNQLLVPGKVTPEKHAEKALRLTCIDPETSKPTSFLFKVRYNPDVIWHSIHILELARKWFGNRICGGVEKWRS